MNYRDFKKINANENLDPASGSGIRSPYETIP